MPSPEDAIDDTVELVENLGEWFVRVTDNGLTTSHPFEQESIARDFAEKQRQRLNVDHIEQV